MIFTNEGYKKVAVRSDQIRIKAVKSNIRNLASKLDLTKDELKILYKNIKEDLRERGAHEDNLSMRTYSKLQAKLKGRIMDAKDEGYELFFNSEPALIKRNEINLFLKKIPDGELYLKHYKHEKEYFTFLYVQKGKKLLNSQTVPSKNSLAVSNDRRDKKLLKIAKDKFDLDIQEQLIKAGEFINNNFQSIFLSNKLLLKRSKKDSQLIRIANQLDKKYKILIHGLTGELHIYNLYTGVYESYNETKFSAFLTSEYSEKFLADEVIKIKGTFSKIKDESENYIAFKNCLFNLETLKTEDFTHEEFITFQIPYNWNPDAYSQDFEERIKEILVDELRLDFFKEFMGYNFTRDNPHNLIVFLIGEGGNGKTTLLSIIKAIFHQSIAAVGLHELETEFGKQPLLGKRINIIPDLKKITLKDMGYLKAITGEDVITVNRKYKDPVTTQLCCKVIGAGNHLPRIEEDTQAIWRRMKVIKLTNTFKDPNVKKNLLNDTEGIEWLIYKSILAYKKVIEDGWSIQKSKEEVRKDYLKSSDPCLYAAEELFEKTNDPDNYVTRHEIVKMISEYLSANQLERPKNNQSYYLAIRKIGGDDFDKKINNKTTHAFCYIKPKDVLKDKETDELTALARNGDEEAQAELDARSLT